VIAAVRLTTALVGILAAAWALADRAVTDHPILGYWRLASLDGRCVETHQFGADGRSHATSGEEAAVSKFDISSEPLRSGYYRIVDTIVEDNGLPDCSGSVTPVGDTSTMYVLFSVSGDSFLLCEAERQDSCFARATRL
jgi:hypothetical protein